MPSNESRRCHKQVTSPLLLTTMSTILRQATKAVRCWSLFRWNTCLYIFYKARQASCTRAFASSASTRKGSVVSCLHWHPWLIPNPPADLVQDIYLREIKAYKPVPAVSIWNFDKKNWRAIIFIMNRRLKMLMSVLLKSTRCHRLLRLPYSRPTSPPNSLLTMLQSLLSQLRPRHLRARQRKLVVVVLKPTSLS